MATIRLTAKRQATFPRRVCTELRLRPGDALALEEKVIAGERVWVLRRAPAADVRRAPWFGRLRRYARGKSAAMTAIRRSIERARQDGRI